MLGWCLQLKQIGRGAPVATGALLAAVMSHTFTNPDIERNTSAQVEDETGQQSLASPYQLTGSLTHAVDEAHEGDDFPGADQLPFGSEGVGNTLLVKPRAYCSDSVSLSCIL